MTQNYSVTSFILAMVNDSKYQYVFSSPSCHQQQAWCYAAGPLRSFHNRWTRPRRWSLMDARHLFWHGRTLPTQTEGTFYYFNTNVFTFQDKADLCQFITNKTKTLSKLTETNWITIKLIVIRLYITCCEAANRTFDTSTIYHPSQLCISGLYFSVLFVNSAKDFIFSLPFVVLSINRITPKPPDGCLWNLVEDWSTGQGRTNSNLGRIWRFVRQYYTELGRGLCPPPSGY